MWTIPKMWKPSIEKQTEPWPAEPDSFRSWPCLSMAPAGRYAAVYRGGMLLCYLGPIGEAYPAILDDVNDQAAKMDGTVYEFVRR